MLFRYGILYIPLLQRIEDFLQYQKKNIVAKANEQHENEQIPHHTSSSRVILMYISSRYLSFVKLANAKIETS
jgi:hypothetical protein